MVDSCGYYLGFHLSPNLTLLMKRLLLGLSSESLSAILRIVAIMDRRNGRVERPLLLFSPLDATLEYSKFLATGHAGRGDLRARIFI